MKGTLEHSHSPSKILVFSVTIVGLLHNSIFVSSTPEILRSFGESENFAGLLIAAGSVPGIIVAPAIGFLADRHGRRKILVPCLAIFGFFGILASLSPSFEWLLAIRFIQGLGSAGIINLVIVIITDNWKGLDRARLIGQNAAVITTSVAVYPVIGGVITDLVGWRWTFLTFLAPLIVAFFIWKRLEDHQPGLQGPIKEQLLQASIEVRKPVIATCIIISVIVFMGIFGIFQALLPVHLDRSFGLLPTERGLVALAPSITAALAALAVTKIRSRIQGGVLIYMSMFFWGVSFLFMGFSSLVLLILATMVYGFSEGIMLPTLQDLVAEHAPSHLRGGLLAIWTGAARLGQTLGPISISLALIGASSTSVLALSGILMIIFSGLAAATRTLIVSHEDKQGGRFIS